MENVLGPVFQKAIDLTKEVLKEILDNNSISSLILVEVQHSHLF